MADADDCGSYHICVRSEDSGQVVGSLLRYFNVAVIPGFQDARICGRLPRLRTLVPGAEGRSPCGLGTFPALQILRSATADVPQVALSESSRTCRARGCTM